MMRGAVGSSSMRLRSFEICWSRVRLLGTWSRPHRREKRGGAVTTAPGVFVEEAQDADLAQGELEGAPPRRARSSAGNTCRSRIVNGGACASARVRRQRRVTARMRATTSLTPKGLTMKSSAPSSSPSTRSISSDLALMKMIGTSGLRARISRQHVVAVLPRHHDVQQHEVRRFGVEARERVAPVGGGEVW